MKTTKRFQLAYAATVFALLALPFAAYALVSYAPGALLQPADVATTTLRDYSVRPQTIASNNNFTFSGLNSTNSTSTNATTTTLAVTGPAISLNGVTYNTPSNAGVNGNLLTTDGIGTLTWASGATSFLTYTGTAGETINKGDAVAFGIEATTTTFGQIGTIAGDTIATWTHAYVAGYNPNSVEMCFIRTNATDLTSIPTSVTYAGVAMTRVGIETGNGRRHFVYYLANPTVGSNNAIVTWGGAVSGAMDCINYYGTTLNLPTNVASSTVASATSLSSTLNTHTASSSVDVVFASSAGNVGASTNTTLRSEASTFGVLDSNGGVNTTGSYTQTVTSSLGAMDMIQVELQSATDTTQFIYRASAATSTAERNTAFIGFANSSVSSGQSLAVITNGLFSNAINLTRGSLYYLGNVLGSIGTTTGTATHKVGVAVSSTALMLMNSF